MATRTENELLGSLARAQVGLKALELQALLDLIKVVNRYSAWPQVKEFSKNLEVVAAREMFIANEFFITNDGLCVWPGFERLILPAYQLAIRKRGLDGVKCLNLPRDMFGHEIITNYLGGEEEARKHAFTPDQIAEIINIQPGILSGGLLQDNNTRNIFFVIGKDRILFPVNLRWGAFSSSVWLLDALDVDGGGRWSVGDRVFFNTIQR